MAFQFASYFDRITSAAILWTLVVVQLTRMPKVQYEMYVYWTSLRSLFY